MNKIRIKIKLIKMGILQKDIADTLGLDPSTVSQVISGKRKSRKISDYIADLTGLKKAA